MLSCCEFLADFGDYLDGSLTEEVHQELEAHLSQCRTCQVIHDSTRKTLRLVSDSGSFELPAAAAESLVTKIMALEQRVKERTAELSKSNALLKQEIAEGRRAETAVHKSNQELTKTLQALRSTQAQLVQTAKMASLGHLVAGIAHEINSPVGAVSSASDVTDRCLEKIEHAIDRGDGGNLKRTLGVLAEANRVTATAGRRMAEVVRTLGSFAGLDEAEFKKTDVQASIDNTLTLLSRELRDRVAVTKEYGQIPQIDCCPNELHQMFMNLLQNCSEAIEGKGNIGIKTYAERGKVYVVISDSGKGIPPENINQIFDPGFTTKGAGVGTGLGLSITYNIVKKHQGEINVESQHGEGTKVTVILPTDLTPPAGYAKSLKLNGSGSLS